MVEIREGQIWREDDKRLERFIRVTCVRSDEITFRTCDVNGAFKPNTRFSCAKIERFGRSGGYKLVRDTP